MTKIALASLIGVAAAGLVQAQEVPPFTFNIGAGFVEPMRTFGQYTDMGWNIQGGAGFNLNRWASAKVDVNYNQLGINSFTLDQLGAPGGHVGIWSFTFDPVIHLTAQKPVDVYVTGGAGLFRREDQLTQPAVGYETVVTPIGFFNAPFVGNEVLSSYSVNKFGWDAGGGLSFGSKWHGRFYAEMHYDRILTNNGLTDYIPVTFGFQF